MFSSGQSLRGEKKHINKITRKILDNPAKTFFGVFFVSPPKLAKMAEKWKVPTAKDGKSNGLKMVHAWNFASVGSWVFFPHVWLWAILNSIMICWPFFPILGCRPIFHSIPGHLTSNPRANVTPDQPSAYVSTVLSTAWRAFPRNLDLFVFFFSLLFRQILHYRPQSWHLSPPNRYLGTQPPPPKQNDHRVLLNGGARNGARGYAAFVWQKHAQTRATQMTHMPSLKPLCLLYQNQGSLRHRRITCLAQRKKKYAPI